MKVFAIRDEEEQERRDVGWLLYYEKAKKFFIELPENADPTTLPILLYGFAKRGIYSVGAHWSEVWVNNRIIPEERQNLGMVLKENGLKEYDKFQMLMLANGRCAQDACYLVQKKFEDLPETVRERFQKHIQAVVPLTDNRILFFCQNGQSAICDVKQTTLGDRRFKRLLAYYDYFIGVAPEAGGYGVTWGEDQTLDIQTLLNQSEETSIRLDDYRQLMAANILTTAEVTEILQCSRQYVNELVKAGKLRPLKASEKNTTFFKSDVDAYLAEIPNETTDHR